MILNQSEQKSQAGGTSNATSRKVPMKMVLRAESTSTVIRLRSAQGLPPMYVPVRSKALKIRIDMRLYQLP